MVPTCRPNGQGQSGRRGEEHVKRSPPSCRQRDDTSNHSPGPARDHAKSRHCIAQRSLVVEAPERPVCREYPLGYLASVDAAGNRGGKVAPSPISSQACDCEHVRAAYRMINLCVAGFCLDERRLGFLLAFPDHGYCCPRPRVEKAPNTRHGSRQACRASECQTTSIRITRPQYRVANASPPSRMPNRDEIESRMCFPGTHGPLPLLFAIPC